MKRVLVWSAIALAAAILFLIVAGSLYTSITTAGPEPAALDALASDAVVHVGTDGWITFTPADSDSATGLVLYPGGFVDPRAYAPVARRIAAEGYLVAIPSMPLNLAVLRPDRANAIFAAYPEIEHWAIAGHSLGGVMAARFAARNTQLIDALILWAAYPPDSVDLSQTDLLVTSIYGTQDGLVSREDIDDSRARLPSTTWYVAIEGGNHAQFGSYGVQKGDLPPLISADEQQAQIAAATVETLRQISAPSR
jgi:dienelactone hydrolase